MCRTRTTPPRSPRPKEYHTRESNIPQKNPMHHRPRAEATRPVCRLQCEGVITATPLSDLPPYPLVTLRSDLNTLAGFLATIFNFPFESCSQERRIVWVITDGPTQDNYISILFVVYY
jgi:hypothetical protein